MVVGGVILGLDRQRQRLDGSQVQGSHFLGVFRFSASRRFKYSR